MYPEKSLKSFIKTVAAAGTAEPLSATPLFVEKCFIKGLKANTDLIFIGDSTVSSTAGYEVAAQEKIELHELVESKVLKVDLGAVYIDAAVNGEGVCVLYLD